MEESGILYGPTEPAIPRVGSPPALGSISSVDVGEAFENGVAPLGSRNVQNERLSQSLEKFVHRVRGGDAFVGVKTQQKVAFGVVGQEHALNVRGMLLQENLQIEHRVDDNERWF